MSLLAFVIIAAASLVGVVAVSFVVEALRAVPQTPRKLAWAPDIPVQFADLGGVNVRFIKTGSGPNLVLLHTLRTQLDLFEKVVPELAREFTVYALDYPGHGYSDIPQARYDADFFVRVVERFLDALDLRDVTLCGVSIGASVALILAAGRNDRLVRVIAVNPYDYGRGRGMARSSPIGWLITAAAQIPILGETVMRLRHFLILKSVLQGEVADPLNIRPELMKEMYAVGDRRGHYRALISLLRNAASFEAASAAYRSIKLPVLLVWGRPGLGKAFRARARSRAHCARPNGDGPRRRTFPPARPSARADRSDRPLRPQLKSTVLEAGPCSSPTITSTISSARR
jgi:pimeloyl-ACP methyl ester carboxylesterase